MQLHSISKYLFGILALDVTLLIWHSLVGADGRTGCAQHEANLLILRV